MKNYKYLVPVFLIAVFLLSIYKLHDARTVYNQEYEDYLNKARAKRTEGIYVDTKEYYRQALAIKPSVELYDEIGEFYVEYGQIDAAIGWGEEIVSHYPHKKDGYEFLFKLYNRNEDYIACFKLYDKLTKRKVKSDYIKEEIKRMEYFYYFRGEYLSVGSYTSGLCPVRAEGNWGYVNVYGVQVIASAYSQAGAFFEEVAPIIDKEGNVYFIDTQGNKKHVVMTVNDAKEMSLIYNGIFALKNGDKWGFYNLEYEHVFGEYDGATSLANGVAAVRVGEEWTLINEKGEPINDTKYTEVLCDERGVVCRNGRIFVKEQDDYYMIDNLGNRIGTDTYREVNMFMGGVYAAVKKEDKWEYIDRDGKRVLDNQYDDARSFSNGYGAVMIDGKWGFIDMEGNLVIDAVFDNAKDINERGCVYVNDGGIWTLLVLIKYNH